MASRGSSYLKWKKKAFSSKYLGDAFIRGNREMLQAWADLAAAGYNTIVSDFSPKSKPRFTGEVEYQRGTKRMFARVRIHGSDDKKARFEAIDFGAERGATISAPISPVTQVVEMPVIPREIREKWYYLPKEQQEYYEDRKRHTRQLTKHERRVMAGGGKVKMLPMRPYRSITGKGGRIGGPGEYSLDSKKNPEHVGWKSIPYKYEVTQGPIEARNFSIGLWTMAKHGNDPFGMGHIWPVNMEFRRWARRSYDRGVRYAKAGRQT